ncbi:hypothetical protein M5G25_29035 [Pseudomonas sp. TNT2022 ID357]|jgi:hypothetical protein|uniref:Uncharacterized protein n=1 Tax=Pseudomonas idahonensis TaxID=2942628 RepID=A0ABT5QDN1_9PSED|nr:hypothetical protein [Pseudomonas idahonensis]
MNSNNDDCISECLRCALACETCASDGVGFPAPSHVLQIGSNPAAILINDDLSVFFDEGAALLLRQKVED